MKKIILLFIFFSLAVEGLFSQKLINQYSVTCSNPICNISEGQQFGLSGTEIGVTYSLFLADTPGEYTGTNKGIIIGSGNSQLFPLVYEEGEYFVIGDNGVDCSLPMLNRVTLAINHLTEFDVSSDVTNVCVRSEVNISIGGSDNGIDYELNIDGIPSGIIIVGDGNYLKWSVTESVDGVVIYEVIANPGQTCELSMGTVDVSYRLKPSPFAFISENGVTEYLNGEFGIKLGVSGSQKEIGYLLHNSKDEIIGYQTGDGAPFYFPYPHYADSYYATAIDFGSGCTSEMLGNITLSEKSISTNIEEVNDSKSIEVYPAIVESFIFIEKNNYNVDNLEIYNMIGAKVYSCNLNSQVTDIDLSHLQNGYHLLKIGNEVFKIYKK